MTTNDTTSGGEISANDLAGDLLSGAKEIGRFLGLSERQVYYLFEVSDAPLFKFSNSPRAELKARRSALTAWVAEQEREAAADREAKRAAKRKAE